MTAPTPPAAASCSSSSSSSLFCCIDLGRSIWKGEQVLRLNRCLSKRLRFSGVRIPGGRVLKALNSQTADGDDVIKQQSRAQRNGSSNQSLSPKLGGSGFGASSLQKSSSPSKLSKEKKNKTYESGFEDERDSEGTVSSERKWEVTRRAPPRKLLTEAQPNPKPQPIETFALLALTLVFLVIIVEGLALACSGFLPEEWDEYLLKAVYPSFTPTVAVFFAGGIAYGLYKYLGGGMNK